ncbi:MAG: ExbD/TolR family protein [Desulfovibrionaceae bacterium]
MPRPRRVRAEINVTPFVDVMLVLLAIFLITVPLMNQGLDVDLPRTRTVESLPRGSDHFILTIRADGRIFLDQRELTPDRLEDHIRQLVIGQGRYLYLRADAAVPHGTVVKVLGELKAAGLDRVGIIAEPETAPGTPSAPAPAAPTAPEP